eukprot:523567-Prymnesium_polylepis.1
MGPTVAAHDGRCTLHRPPPRRGPGLAARRTFEERHREHEHPAAGEHQQHPRRHLRVVDRLEVLLLLVRRLRLGDHARPAEARRVLRLLERHVARRIARLRLGLVLSKLVHREVRAAIEGTLQPAGAHL